MGDCGVYIDAQLEFPVQTTVVACPTTAIGETIHEVSPEHEDSIAQMCQQLTQGLSAMSSEDPFANFGRGGAGGATQGHMMSSSTGAHLVHQASMPVSSGMAQQHVLMRQHTSPASQSEYSHPSLLLAQQVLGCE